MAAVIKWIKEYIVWCCLIAVAVLTSLFWVSKLSMLKDECSRLERNQQTLLEQCDTLTMANGKHIARAQKLELTTAELNQQCSDLQARLEDMGIQNKYLQMAVYASTQMSAQVDTVVRDSIVYIPQLVRLDTLQVLSWADAWVQLDGILHKGRFTGSITSVDTLTVAVHRVPKKFWFIKWGTKRVDVSVASSNPHTEINAVRCVEIRK